MKTIRVAALCGLISAPACAFAADLFSTPPAIDNQFIEITNAWYLRGDVGASFDPTPTLSFDASVFGAPPGPTISPSATGSSTQVDWDADVGVGYRFNEYFRMDATFDYRSGIRFNSITPGIVCPYNATPVYSEQVVGTTVINLPLGYQYDTNDTCNANFALKQQNYTTLLNGYFDLFNYAGFTPYVGAGIGFNVQSTSGSLNFTESGNGQPYRADLTPSTSSGSTSAGLLPTNTWVTPNGTPVTPQPKISFAPQNWDRTYSKTVTSFAFDVTAGLGYQLTHEATLDLSYRFIDYGRSVIGVNPNTGASVTQNNTAQEVRIGVRYTPE
jgi:opacity protein-like surface antigen